VIFVDTGAWFALLVADDPCHDPFRDFRERSTEAFVTTDYVLDETLTLLKVRRSARLAIEASRPLWDGTLGRVEYCTRPDIEQGLAIFRKYRDKGWSFTDCTSFAFMKRRGLTLALATDGHFDQLSGIRRAMFPETSIGTARS
jgi:predicted nucleic acid-binding protein